MVAKKPATLITGIAPHSIGESLLDRLREFPDRRVVTIDRARFEAADGDGIVNAVYDLNPFAHASYGEYAAGLSESVRGSVAKSQCDSVESLVSSAGVYAFGPMERVTPDVRSNLLGVNVLARYELLGAVMAVNQEAGFANRDVLSYVDVGSLHGLRTAPGRSLYGPSKGVGAGLCASLHADKEVRRAIYVAFGPVDTQMLHRNYWVEKERGPSEFVEAVFAAAPELYRSVFVECGEAAFADACKRCDFDRNAIKSIFGGYVARRQEQLRGEEGIIPAAAAGEIIFGIINEPAAHPSGLYRVTAPRGTVEQTFTEFKSGIWA